MQLVDALSGEVGGAAWVTPTSNTVTCNQAGAGNIIRKIACDRHCTPDWKRPAVAALNTGDQSTSFTATHAYAVHNYMFNQIATVALIDPPPGLAAILAIAPVSAGVPVGQNP